MTKNQDNKILNTYYELGEVLRNLSTRIDIINIDVNTALETGESMKDENLKLKFYGGCYLELVEELRKAGILNN